MGNTTRSGVIRIRQYIYYWQLVSSQACFMLSFWSNMYKTLFAFLVLCAIAAGEFHSHPQSCVEKQLSCSLRRTHKTIYWCLVQGVAVFLISKLTARFRCFKPYEKITTIAELVSFYIWYNIVFSRASEHVIRVLIHAQYSCGRECGNASQRWNIVLYSDICCIKCTQFKTSTYLNSQFTRFLQWVRVQFPKRNVNLISANKGQGNKI